MIAFALLIAAVTATFSFADHVDLESRASEVSLDVVICTGPGGAGCIAMPGPPSCISFKGDLANWNKPVTTVFVPETYACTFFQDFDCTRSPGTFVVLPNGHTNLREVSFDNVASSFTCSARP